MLTEVRSIETEECPHEEWTDEQLFLAYRNGNDMDAFNALVKKYERELYSYLRRYLNDACLAEETFQETFINLIRRTDSFEAERRFRPWLYTIATNAAIDCKRRNKRHTKVSLDAHNPNKPDGESTLNDSLKSKEPNGSEQLSLVANQEWVRQHLEDLTLSLRQVVYLVYFEGLKYQDAADEIGIPIGTVKSRLHAGIEKLHEAWDEEEARDAA